MTSNPLDLLIVGAGPAARMHAKAAKHLGLKVGAVSRQPASAAAFREAVGLPCDAGGLGRALARGPRPRRAIVAVGVEALLDASLELLAAGVTELLVEKPGGLDLAQITRLADASRGARVFIAYNRRFYASVLKSRELIEEDGGPTSLRFDFTERSDLVAASGHPPEVKRNWVLANSSHVIDLAFFLAGMPQTLHAEVIGSLDWAPDGACFTGCGITERGAAFSYHADWRAPGRWSVDIRTRRRRLLFEPLEELRVQKVGSFALDSVALPPEPEGQKPGLLGQLRAFLDGGGALPSVADHAVHVAKIFMPIATGRGATQ